MSSTERRPFLITMTGKQLCAELQLRSDSTRKQAGEEKENEQMVQKLRERYAIGGGLVGDPQVGDYIGCGPQLRKRSDLLLRQAEEIDALIRYIDQGRTFDLNFAELTGLGLIRFGLGTAFAGGLIGAADL